MPTNRNAQLRYRILDHCFSDYLHKYTIEDLMEKVNDTLYDLYGKEVSLRQIREDIKYMRERMAYDAPIQAYPLEGKKCYYRYEDPDFSIFKSNLSTEEIEKLRSTIEMLGRYRGLPNNAWLEEVISNLEFRFGIKSNRENLVAFDQNEQLRGLEFLSDIIDATVKHIPIKIHYKTYSGKESVCIVHPYHVKQYNNRWFLFGLEEKSGKITNKALDRIQKATTVPDIRFKPNTRIDFTHFFDDIVGVSVPDETIQKEHIVLRLTENRYPYVVSKPLHPSQQIVDETNRLISIDVKPTKELDQKILSFGPDMEVLNPPAYRKHIREKLEAAIQKY